MGEMTDPLLRARIQKHVDTTSKVQSLGVARFGSTPGGFEAPGIDIRHNVALDNRLPTSDIDITSTPGLIESAFDESTDAAWLILLTLSHPIIKDRFNDDIRVVNNYELVISNGLEYDPFPVDIVLPDDTEDSPPRARIRISNVSQEIIGFIRLADTPIQVKFQIVNGFDPDVVELEYNGFTIRNINADVIDITGDLLLDDMTTEQFPAYTFVPSYFPGLFI